MVALGGRQQAARPPTADGPGPTARCKKMDATPESDAADVGFDGGRSQDHTHVFAQRTACTRSGAVKRDRDAEKKSKA